MANVQIVDPDLRWLVSCRPKVDLLNVFENRVKPLLERISGFQHAQLPHTVGLFGSWGSGKTTMLALLAQELSLPAHVGRFDVVYFNAWRYAGQADVVPALIYRLLKAAPPTAPDAAKDRLKSILVMLAD